MAKTRKVPVHSYESLRAVAGRFLRDFHPKSTIPVPIEEIIDNRFSVDIVPVPGLHDDVEADAFISSDLSTIYIDEFVYKHRENRYRFSLAHELSHVLLHQKVFKEMAFKTINEWKKAIHAMPEDEYGWLEWQAYALAGLILVPRDALREHLTEAQKKASRAGLSLSAASDVARHIISGHLADQFKVSRPVIEKRLDKDKLW